MASTNDAAWRSDLDTLTRELPRRHVNPFFRISAAEFESASAALRDDIPALTDAQVAVRVMQLVALLGDSHTTVGGWSFVRLPIGVYWFDDGIYVTAATAANADLIGTRVVAVGGTAALDVMQRVATLFAHENDSWLRQKAPSFFVAPEVLQALGITDDPQAATFTFERGDGTRFERTLRAMLIPSGFVQPPATFAQSRPQPNYWSAYLAAQRTLYIRYNRCANDPAKPFDAFVREAFANAPIERLIIDLRENPGGNSAVLAPLIGAIQSSPALNRADRLFVLIGRATFSSAMLNALDLDRQTNATLVGEPTGGKPNAYGEILNFALPNSRLTIFYSTKYFALMPGSDPPSVDPEVRLSVFASPYFGGFDPTLDSVLPKSGKRRSARH
ncbi:MAG TPA: hypothetical protein VF824_19310 [Thermoanaerobaculia bacterium]